MRDNNSLKIVREVARGRLEITRETSDEGSRITIIADRIVAIVAAALMAVALMVFV